MGIPTPQRRALFNAIDTVLSKQIVVTWLTRLTPQRFCRLKILIAAIIVMLGRVPLGQLLTRNWPEAVQLPNMTEVIMAYPNMAAFRGILMGAALGVMAMGLRIILGIERSYLGGEK